MWSCNSTYKHGLVSTIDNLAFLTVMTVAFLAARQNELEYQERSLGLYSFYGVPVSEYGVRSPCFLPASNSVIPMAPTRHDKGNGQRCLEIYITMDLFKSRMQLTD